MITLYGSCRWFLGESREVQPLWLIGEFSALLAMRFGKFPNKLWYFLRKYLCALSVCRLNSLVDFAVCARYIRFTHFAEYAKLVVAVPVLAQPKLSIYYFPLSVGGGGAVVSVCKGFSCMGRRKQGLGEESTRRMRVEIVPLTA